MFIHNTLPPYRMPVFEDLFDSPQIALDLCICLRNHGRWDLLPKNYDYDYTFLRGVTLKIPSKALTFSLNPEIVTRIVKRRPNAIIIGEIGNPTMQLAFLLGKFLKIPVILGTESHDFLHRKSILGWIYAPLRKLTFRYADAIVVPGRLSQEYAIQQGSDSSRVFVAPNSVDNDFFFTLCSKYRREKETLKEELGIKADKIILFVGRIIEVKGVFFLLNAFARLKQVHENCALVFVGNGPAKDNLLRMRDATGIRDVFFVESGLGFGGIIKYYSIADVLVLPTTLAESWGMVVNEAMACGLPVIATRVVAAAHDMIVQGVNGFIIRERDSEELFKALRRLMCDEKLLKSASLESLKIVRNRFNRKLQRNGFLDAVIYVCAHGVLRRANAK
jgi:glycosyltransferase involved in cell wall biosynthesis